MLCFCFRCVSGQQGFPGNGLALLVRSQRSAAKLQAVLLLQPSTDTTKTAG